jgi:TolA-binding protein
MSDRRSFSEIPEALLRDQVADDRVERVWRRLETKLKAPRPRARPSPGYTVLLAFTTFALGIFVGSRFLGSADAPLATLEAEPLVQPIPAAAPSSRPAAQQQAVSKEAPRVHSGRHAAVARRVDVEETTLPEPPVVVSPPQASEWQRLADEGQYSQALSALESTGGFDAVLRDATAEQLMSLVDVARATGQRDRAILALRRIVSEHGTDPNAPVAAWMLGNELAKVNDLVGAEQAFAMYRALSPNGDFAEDALGRQIDMAQAQGDLEHAKILAGQYMKEFPDGPRSADIQAELERMSRESTPAAAGETEVRSAPVPSASTDELFGPRQ